MEEMAASSSRARVALAFSFSAARLSAGAAFSVAFGGIDLSCELGLVITGRVGLVNGPFKVFGLEATASLGPDSAGRAGISARAVEAGLDNVSIFKLFIMPSVITTGVGHLRGYPPPLFIFLFCQF